MKLELRGSEGGIVRAACSGSMTLLPTGGPGDALKQVLGGECYRSRLLLDLGGVDYIDSSGVSWLLLLHSHCADAGGKLVLHSLQTRVRGTFDLLQLGSVLHLASDESAARQLCG